MATRDDVQAVLDRVNRDLERPVPIKTDSFGKKSIDQNTYQIGMTLAETQKLLENVLKDGLTD
ncbi:hypothetical protein SEA_DAMASCUS_62 [Microbacterium phage Damascus]|nr:hypothetical protein SEA_DAMASCUS_62 [Microbacterium phage Damascus]